MARLGSLSPSRKPIKTVNTGELERISAELPDGVRWRPVMKKIWYPK